MMATHLPSSHPIFLSYEGETRTTFTDHLYTALCNAGFPPFRDKDDMKIGHQIKPQLQRAIQQSTLSIVVISKRYGYSKWCLDELVNILQRKNVDDGYIVFPIFYYVQPRDVGNQKGSFEDAFDGFLKNGEHSKDKIDQWRQALKEVSKIAGKVLRDKSNGYESAFIKEIVEIVRTTLQQRVSNVASRTVGIESRVKEIDTWLKDLADVGIGVISGMPGIGKTTIAEIAYNRNVANFEASSFLRNIREASELENGLVHLRIQLLSDISKEKKKKIDNTDEGTVKVENAISPKRFLIILDGVDHIEQVNALIRASDLFIQQSKILITTSHVGLLSNQKHKSFIVKPLDCEESLQLFSVHAFLQESPTEDYMELSIRVVAHCEGRPLSLKRMGSSLHGKHLDFWKEVLKGIKSKPDERIYKTSQFSYEQLEDKEKKLFLTIALSFVGQDMDATMKILEKDDFYSKVGMQNLMDRSLLRVDNHNKLIMHPSLLVMARAITDQETVDCSGKSNFYDSSETKSETVITDGSLLCKNDKLGKRKREDESVPPKVHSSNSFKRFCHGFFSLFEPATCFKRLLNRGGTQ